MTRLLLASALAVAACAMPLAAQQPVGPHADPAARTPTDTAPTAEGSTRRGDDDEPDVPAITIGRWFAFGGSAQAEWDTVRRPAGIARGAVEPEMGSVVQVRATLTPANGVVFFTRTELRRSFLTDVPGWWRGGQTRARLVEAYADVDRLFGLPVGVRVGRQRFRDAREWFFDDYLDAVRLRSQAGRWRFDIALTGTMADTPPLQRETEQRQHVIATASRRATRVMRVTGFFVRRFDVRTRDDAPWWLGGSLASRGERTIMFHAAGALLRGRTGDVRRRAWATDASVSWHIDASWRPVISLAHARASGDTSTSDGIDSGFRQTGLHDNSSRVGGIRRVRMYGEAFDPELSNIQIATAAASLRPWPTVSLDLLAHRYTQVVARRRLGDHAFDARANGRDRSLGNEVDLQLVVRPSRRLDLRLIVGIFRPGKAFDTQPGADVGTVVWRPQVRVYF